MATFHIHQDAEKENPHIAGALKEKTIGGGVGGAARPNALQKSTLGSIVVGGVGGGVGAAFKDKQGRPNFAVLNNKANNNGNANAARIITGSKVAFREVSNVKKDENAAYATATATNNATNIVGGNGGGCGGGGAIVKKSTVVPVVEQFKTFSVYEDQSEILKQQQGPGKQQQQRPQSQQHVAETHTTITATTVEIDKENVYVEQQRTKIDVNSCDPLQREYSINEEDYVLNTTPMSVSDVLSPMSVDRSHMSTHSTSKLTDDSNCNKIAEQQQQQQQQDEPQRPPLPRNDRQRFFEVLEYQHAILEYFRDSEKKHRPKPHYMRRQTDINDSMRTILVDWLVEVSEEYNLDTETLYLSVSYIDRFLSHMSVVRSKLQLVGTAAMYIASKYEEIYPPDVGEFVFITDDTYSKAQVLRMEQIILKILAFDLCTPTAYVFINTYAVLTDMTDKLKYLTHYICELSLLKSDPFLRYYPSLISAASHALARHLLDYPIWSSELEEITTYSINDLKEVFLHLCKSHNDATTATQQAIQEKYKADKYKRVSSLQPIDLTEELFDEIVRKYQESAENEKDNREQQSTLTTTSSEHVRKMISLMFN